MRCVRWHGCFGSSTRHVIMTEGGAPARGGAMEGPGPTMADAVPGLGSLCRETQGILALGA
jgi:hypothetical protein